VRLTIQARVVLAQIGIGGLGALLWWSLGGPRDALGALAGGTIGAASSLYLALRTSSSQRVDAPAGWFLVRFVAGWFVKVMVAVGLLLVAAKLAPDVLPALVSTFAAAVLVYPLVGMFMGKERY